MSDFKMSTSEVSGGIIIKLEGSLELAACTALERGLLGLTARKPKLAIFDLSGLTFISSLAMGSIVSFRTGVTRAGGKVFLAGMSPLILECFRRPRLTMLFEVRDSVTQCLPAD
jgi:anti-anti-sigma factor